MIEFAYPWFLLLLLPAAAIGYYLFRKPQPTLQIPSLKPFAKAEGRGRSWLSRLPAILYCVAMTLLIVALARPRKGLEQIVQRAQGIDIILALDLSGSMESYDPPSGINDMNTFAAGINKGTIENRVETAKKEVEKFIRKRPNDRIGLIVFADRPLTVCPPTLDHDFLIGNLERLKANLIGRSTGIAAPIASAVHRLMDSEAKRRVVVLFTDGKNMVDAKITPRMAAKLAKRKNVVVYTVGIGSNVGYVIQPDFFGSNQLVRQPGQFDEKLLKDIAKISAGKYYTARDAKGLEQTMNEIDKMEKTTVEQPRIMNYREWAPIIMGIAILLLLTGVFAENTVFMTVP